MSECALWYKHYHQPGFELCDSEEEAATSAFYMEDSGNAAVTGVQFPDGRTIRRGEWPAYAAVAARILAAEREANAKREAEPPQPVRRILDPFDGTPIDIDADAVAWIGRQPDQAASTA